METMTLGDAVKLATTEFNKAGLGQLQDFEIQTRIIDKQHLVEVTFLKRGNVRGGGLRVTIDVVKKSVVKKLWLQ